MVIKQFSHKILQVLSFILFLSWLFISASLYCNDHISPHSVITHASFGRLFGPVWTFSIFRTTKRLSPSTLCNLINQPNYQSIPHSIITEKDKGKVELKRKMMHWRSAMMEIGLQIQTQAPKRKRQILWNH